jgi:hypothetical protein
MTGQLNPNQFALPGMEQHAHAGAELLAKGLSFDYRSTVSRSGTSTDHEHRLSAQDKSLPWQDREVSHLKWAGSEDDYSGYPGEIIYVGTKQTQRGRGIASALYGMATDPNVATGNDTVPLHSTTRTVDGYNWSAKVGGWDPEVYRSEVEQRLSAERGGEHVPYYDLPDESDVAQATRHMHPRFQREDQETSEAGRAKDPYVGTPRQRLPGTERWGR